MVDDPADDTPQPCPKCALCLGLCDDCAARAGEDWREEEDPYEEENEDEQDVD